MVEENQADTEANPTVLVQSEAETPVGPTVEQLQAQIKAWETRYGKEVGDRDRGNARLAREIKELRDDLAQTQKGTEALARRTFGEEEPIVESETQKWKDAYQRKAPPPDQASPSADLPPEVAELNQRISSLVAQLGVTSNYVPPEMQDHIDTASGKWNRGDIQGSHDYLEKVVQARSKPPEKTRVSIPQDRMPSQGGGNRRAWTEAQIAAMSDKEYATNRDAIEAAQREGRIQLTRS